MGQLSAGIRLAAAVARAALRVLQEERLAERADEMGTYFLEQLAEIPSPHVTEVRGKGLLIGVELRPEAGGARRFCEALAGQGHPRQGNTRPRRAFCAAADHRQGHDRLGASGHSATSSTCVECSSTILGYEGNFADAEG